MGNFKIVAENGETKKDIYEIVVDTPEDIIDLPRHFGTGSVAIVVSTAEVYMKNNEGEWVKL